MFYCSLNSTQAKKLYTYKARSYFFTIIIIYIMYLLFFVSFVIKRLNLNTDFFVVKMHLILHSIHGTEQYNYFKISPKNAMLKTIPQIKKKYPPKKSPSRRWKGTRKLQSNFLFGRKTTKNPIALNKSVTPFPHVYQTPKN